LNNIMKVTAIIPAGGAGKRFSALQAKQYLLLAGRPIFAHALETFEKAKIINEIILIVPEKDLLFFKDGYLKEYGLKKIKAILAGGLHRQDSVLNGFKETAATTDIVVVHDAVRPLVTEQMLDAVVCAALETGAAAVGVKAKETIKETDKDDYVVTTRKREDIWHAQTPQAFKYDVLKKAYEKASRDGFYGTDEASLVERMGLRVKMIQGSYENIKITTAEDLLIAEMLLKKNKAMISTPRCGFGYDSHRLTSGRKLILGTVEIPSAYGLEGHSDADALLHAICDALLGAAGLPDIGQQFPDKDEKYKNISSAILLEEVIKMISAADYLVEHIDATIVIEKPKIAPYSSQMAANIANIIGIPKENVSIKAKTNEGMGFIGKGEGMAVFAVASVIKNGR